MAAASSKVIIPAELVACTTEPELREVVLRYQMSFSQDIKRMDPLEKFIPPRFTLYDGQSDLRSHIR